MNEKSKKAIKKIRKEMKTNPEFQSEEMQDLLNHTIKMLQNGISLDLIVSLCEAAVKADQEQRQREVIGNA